MNDQERPRKHVLVVEDDPDFAAFMASVLCGLGYNVSTAHDGEEAMLRVRASPPDMITLDIQMPRKSGALFYRQMKSEEALRAIPVIVVTGLTRNDPDWDRIIHTFLDVDHLPHPEAYLEKPVQPETLVELIRVVFDQQHAKSGQEHSRKGGTQPTCPAMRDPVDRDVSAEHETDQVYLCCKSGIKKPRADPDTFKRSG